VEVSSVQWPWTKRIELKKYLFIGCLGTIAVLHTHVGESDDTFSGISSGKHTKHTHMGACTEIQEYMTI
jgi:hypothetical protein